MAKVVYNIAAVFSSILNLLVFGWLDYFSIFKTYFDTFDVVGKIGAVILFALLIAVPVLIVLICVHRWRVNHQLKHDDTSNKALYREIGRLNKQVLDLVPTAWAGDPKGLHDGKITVPDSLWFVGTANNDDSTFTITDKVYDRAIPIELNERADAFECPRHERVHVTAEHLQFLFQKAKAVAEAADARVEEAQREAASQVDAARSACEAEVADVRSDAAAATRELEGVRQQAADDKQAALDAAAAKHAAELERANAEAQRKIAELTATLQQVKRSLERAEKRDEGNSLSRYLLARLRGEEVPDSADDGDSKGGKR